MGFKLVLWSNLLNRIMGRWPNIVITLEAITFGLRKIIACEATCIMVLLGCMSTTNSQGFVEPAQILFLVAHLLLG